MAHAVGTHLDLFQRIMISPCSVSAVEYAGRGDLIARIPPGCARYP
jgi:hypothetical protein